MGVYKGDIYYGAGKTNCLTYVPKNVNLTGVLHGTIIGSPTINGGVVSGFSTSNYIELEDKYKSTHNAEYVFKFTTSSDVATSQSAIHTEFLFNIDIGSSKMQIYNYGINKNTPFIDSISANTTYWIKIYIEGSSKTYSYSTDGITYTGHTTIIDEGMKPEDTTYHITLGEISIAADRPFFGSIDLSESYIKINNETVWQGEVNTGYITLKTDSKVYIPNGWDIGQVGIYGSPTIADGVVSGFSASNYLTFSDNFRPDTNTWEMLFKVTTGSELSESEEFVVAISNGFTHETRYGTRISISNRKFNFSVTYNGTAWDIPVETATGVYDVQVNTTYYIKFEYTGSAYKLYYSLNGIDFIEDINIASSTPIYNSCTACLIGIWNNGSFVKPFLGSIDLSESYIKINDEIWWQGKKGNGKRVFDEKVIESDLNTGIHKYDNAGLFLTWIVGKPYLSTTGGITPTSGETTPEIGTNAYLIHYNTAENKCYYLEYDSSTDTRTWTQCTLPLGIVSRNSAVGYTSINQVFDWIGYIGSTVFLFPGVKGLCPYEFNPDGTYKNIEFENDKVCILDCSNRGGPDYILIGASYIAFWDKASYSIDSYPTPATNYWWQVYDSKKNMIYGSYNGASYIEEKRYVQAGEYTISSGIITSLTPRAVQTNNTARKIGDVYFCPGKTNCLTSFPKNINWSITDGVLTLKAGSKVYIPNGWTEYTYYKCTTTSWTQPTLSADGTVGGTSYACRCKAYLTNYPAYKAFDSDKTSTIWASTTNAVDNWIEFYSPVELIVSKVSVTNRKEDIPGTFGTVTLQGSLNGTDYYDLARYTNTNSSVSATWSFNTSVQRPAKYLRLYANSQYGSNGDIVVANISFTAQQVTATVESTADDYTYVIGSGKRVFDEVVIDGDKTFNNTGGTGIYPMFYDKYNDTIHSAVPTMGSGTATPTASTSYQLFYNVSENIIYFDGGSWLGGYSLPLGRINATDGVPTPISQHFSWFGFIGSTAFTLPNIEGLCSNGFNIDGTYKNVRGYTDKVQILTYWSNWTRAKQPIFLTNDGIEFTGVANDGYHEGTDRSAYDSLTYQCFYNTKENKTYRSGSTAGQWEQQYRTLLGYINMTSGVISSITHIGAKTTNDLKRVKETYNGSTFVRGYISNATIFEKSTAGTYTVTIPYNGYYELTVIGGGSGGAFEYSAKFADGAAAGGSGAGLIGVTYLTKGSYSVTVGAGGAGKWDNNSAETVTASAGGASKFGSIVTAGGGTAPKAVYNNGTQTAGKGGTLTYTSSAFTSVSLAKNGNNGATATNASTSATYSGGASVHGGYGAGGQAKYGGAYAGGNGYVKVVVYS